MRDYLSIGSTPSDESCAQVGSDRYSRASRYECRAFVNQLRRVFGEEPDGAYIKVKSFPHDFGTYKEVVVEYEEGNPEALEYALKIEGDTPLEWDDEARRELAQEKICTAAGCDHDHAMCVEYGE